MHYGWFRKDGKMVWGVIISYVAGIALVEDSRNCAKHYTVPLTQFNITAHIAA